MFDEEKVLKIILAVLRAGIQGDDIIKKDIAVKMYQALKFNNLLVDNKPIANEE